LCWARNQDQGTGGDRPAESACTWCEHSTTPAKQCSGSGSRGQKQRHGQREPHGDPCRHGRLGRADLVWPFRRRGRGCAFRPLSKPGADNAPSKIAARCAAMTHSVSSSPWTCGYSCPSPPPFLRIATPAAAIAAAPSSRTTRFPEWSAWTNAATAGSSAGLEQWMNPHSPSLAPRVDWRYTPLAWACSQIFASARCRIFVIVQAYAAGPVSDPCESPAGPAVDACAIIYLLSVR
jgi:hypothetical protein